MKKKRPTVESHIKEWKKTIPKGEILHVYQTDTLFIVQRMSPNFAFSYSFGKGRNRNKSND